MFAQVDWGAVDEAVTGGSSVTGEELLVAAIVVAVGVVTAWFVGRWRRRRLAGLHDQTKQFVGLASRIAQIVILAIAVGWALTIIGANIGWLTLVLLVIGLIIVLAARPVLEGMGASAALVTRPAFSVGDEIEVDGQVGEVAEITNRSTVIRLRDARRVHIPNVQMLNKTVTVYTVDRSRRSSIEVTVGFESDIGHVERVLKEALSELDGVDRAGEVRARGLDAGVQLSVRFWHPSGIQDGNEALDQAVRAVVTTLRREGIRFAPPIDIAVVNDPTAPRTDEDPDG